MNRFSWLQTDRKIPIAKILKNRSHETFCLKGHFTNFERVTFFSSLIERINTLEGFFFLSSLKGVMDKIRLLQRVPDVLEHKNGGFSLFKPP